jgi:hypothetical protein
MRSSDRNLSGYKNSLIAYYNPALASLFADIKGSVHSKGDRAPITERDLSGSNKITAKGCPSEHCPSCFLD